MKISRNGNVHERNVSEFDLSEDMVARAADRQSRPRSANKEGCPDYSRRLAVRRCADQLIPNSAHGRH